MTFRLRNWLFLIFSGMLYLGPMLAGLAGYGWSIAPVFLAIFALWVVIVRPGLWPQTPGAWAESDTWVRLLGQVFLQLLLVVFLFGIGRGIGGVLGSLPRMHAGLPLGLSFLSIPLSRLLHPARAAVVQIEPAAPAATVAPASPTPKDQGKDA